MRVLDKSKALTLDESIALLNAARETNIYLHVLFALTLGLRKGEINGLRYTDVNDEARTIYIQRQLGNSKEYITEKKKEYTKQGIPTKTHSSERVLQLPDFVYNVIQEERVIYENNKRRHGKSFQDNQYICCSNLGRPRSSSFHHRTLKRLLIDLGIPNHGLHDLRTTYATLLCSNNFSLKAISTGLGHASEIVTEEHYLDLKTIRLATTFVMDEIAESLLNEIETSNQDFENTNRNNSKTIILENSIASLLDEL